jgi:hypothetical protein
VENDPAIRLYILTHILAFLDLLNDETETRPITDEIITLLRVIASECGQKKPDPNTGEE